MSMKIRIIVKKKWNKKKEQRRMDICREVKSKQIMLEKHRNKRNIHKTLRKKQH